MRKNKNSIGVVTDRKNGDEATECSPEGMVANNGYCSYDLPPFIGRIANKCRTQKRRDRKEKRHQKK